MPIQSTAHKTIGAPAPSNTTPRALRPRSHLLVTGSYAIMLPMGGVASVSKTARDSDGCWESAEIGRAHVELQSRLHLVCRLLLEKKKKETPTLSRPNYDPEPDASLVSVR